MKKRIIILTLVVILIGISLFVVLKVGNKNIPIISTEMLYNEKTSQFLPIDYSYGTDWREILDKIGFDKDIEATGNGYFIGINKSNFISNNGLSAFSTPNRVSLFGIPARVEYEFFDGKLSGINYNFIIKQKDAEMVANNIYNELLVKYGNLKSNSTGSLQDLSLKWGFSQTWYSKVLSGYKPTQLRFSVDLESTNADKNITLYIGQVISQKS